MILYDNAFSASLLNIDKFTYKSLLLIDYWDAVIGEPTRLLRLLLYYVGWSELESNILKAKSCLSVCVCVCFFGFAQVLLIRGKMRFLLC
jgi:hypothetical protein